MQKKGYRKRAKVKLERERMKLKLDIASKNVGQNDNSSDNRHSTLILSNFQKVPVNSQKKVLIKFLSNMSLWPRTLIVLVISGQ